jgi:cytosine/adenosine deaminase-related metal-dependent hydrolase
MLYRAAHVLPVIGTPIRDGAVWVEGDAIRAVGSAAQLQSVAGGRTGPVRDLGEVVLIPGLVNGHCHLELGHLRGRLAGVRPGRRFADWIAEVVASRADTPPARYAESAREGAAESLAAGTTTLADIVSADGVLPALSGSPLRRVAFLEVLGIGSREPGQLEGLDRRLAEASAVAAADPRLTLGVSPHAPYSTSAAVYRGGFERAARLGLPVCTHLAETTEEIEFLELGTGPLRELLDAKGLLPADFRPAGLGPTEFLESAGGLRMGGPRLLLAHMTHPAADDLHKLASAGVSVVYCPRSHEFFGRGRHPFRDLLDAGVNVCLGTDSLASNASLSVLDEMRTVFRGNRTLWPAVILRMATLGGAIALGMGETVGALAPGYAADLVAVPLTRGGPADPLENILSADVPPAWVMAGGKAVAGD